MQRNLQFDSCSKKREMEKTDSAITAGFCSVVVISFALHAKGPRFKTEWKQLFPFEEKYEPFALSVALRMLYLYALFTERAPKDFGLLLGDRFP